MAAVAGVDVGGTNITAARVEGGAVTLREKRATPHTGPDAVRDAIAEAVRALGEVDAVGVGVPGPVGRDGVVHSTANIGGFDEPTPIGSMISDALGGLPVGVGNDANLGALGEVRHGAGQGSRFLLAVWLGTGVGGGLVLDGQPYIGAFGGAGEVGHMVAVPGGAECSCGRRGCLEAYAGRSGMERAARLAAANGEETRLIKAGKADQPIKSGRWAKAVAKGDPVATRLLDDAVRALGHTLGSLINLLDVDTIVFGGGLTEKLGQPLIDRIAEATHPVVMLPHRRRSMVEAALGDDAGVLGAAEYALSQRRG